MTRDYGLQSVFCNSQCYNILKKSKKEFFGYQNKIKYTKHVFAILQEFFYSHNQYNDE